MPVVQTLDLDPYLWPVITYGLVRPALCIYRMEYLSMARFKSRMMKLMIASRNFALVPFWMYTSRLINSTSLKMELYREDTHDDPNAKIYFQVHDRVDHLYKTFGKSVVYQIIITGDRKAPTCSTKRP
jgi:hypothetical protein